MSLEELRREIDVVDRELVDLLNARAQRAVAIGEEKRREGAPVYDPDREEEVLARVTEANKGPLDNDGISEIYRSIVRVCGRIQDVTAADEH